MVGLGKYSVIMSGRLDTPLVEVMFVLLHISVIFLLVNLFVAVLVFAFGYVNNDEGLSGFDRELSEHLWKLLGGLFRCGRGSGSDQVVVKHTMEGYHSDGKTVKWGHKKDGESTSPLNTFTLKRKICLHNQVLTEVWDWRQW